MKAFYPDHYVVSLPEGHRFPMPKYSLLRRRVEEAGLFASGALCVAEQASEEQLTLAHTADYVHRVFEGLLTERELRRIGFPWSAEIVERSRRSVGGTIAGGRAALTEGMAANLAGGTHHAYPDHGQGYCIFNDVAVAARVLQAEQLIRRAVVVDCDVHQGNGTAAMFKNDESVYTFSIHGAKNFPLEKEVSDLDVALPDGADDETYLNALRPGLIQALDEAQAEIAFYIAGADPYLDDRLGRMALSKAGLLARDRLVFEMLWGRRLPVVIVMGGGYARQVEDIAEIHFNTLELAVREYFPRYQAAALKT